MKVLLLEHPRRIEANRCNDIANAPLSASLNTGYICGLLNHHQIKAAILDAYLEKLNYSEIENYILLYQPDILGIHLVYHWQDNQELYRLIEKIKKTAQIKHVTVYGFYPSFAYEEILRSTSAIDSCLLGENELTFLNLTKDYKNQQLKGTAVRKGQKIVATKGEVLIDLDALPFPVRPPSSFSYGEVNISGSRGCYGGCTFCYINPYYGESKRKWRGRKPENIIEEIDEIIKKTDIRYFYFVDPNFFGPGSLGKARVLKLAALLKSRNIRFGIEARVNDIDETSIAALKDAGLCDILVGFESGSNKTLKRLNKLTTVADNEKALKILRKYSIEPSIGFIMFEPHSQPEDLVINFEFLKRNDLLDQLEVSVNVLYHHMIILQGSPSYQSLIKEGRLELSLHSTYEGHTPYLNKNVGAMAEAMNEITQFIFLHMKDTWHLSHLGNPKIKLQYQKINALLIETFEALLVDIQNTNPDISEIKNQVSIFQRKLMAIIS
ncbi:MAG: B12-binding domain-containing radical SAM protein [Eubacteriaceae bacterium]